MTGHNALVLDIFKQADSLKMSLSEQGETASTLHHYSVCQVDFPEINKICQEVVSILNKMDRSGTLAPELIRGLRKAGQFLWDHLLTRPIKERLKNTNITELMLFMDEELVDIPWELIYDGASFLCLNFSLGRLVRTRQEATPVQYRLSHSGALKMLILANPTNDLKNSYHEGINIRNQFDRRRNNVHIDFKSTSIDRIYVKKNLCDYDIVHFAGHCEYDADDSSESGWVLSDGKFTTADILNLGTTVSLPALLFSNACYSAKTPQEFVGLDYHKRNYSLASAFLFSGVRHYIGSIRRIEDPVSLTFAREFYIQLLYGKSVGESIRLSRLKLIKEHGITAIHWSSYLLYGDPSFVLFRPAFKPALTKKRIALLFKKRLKQAIMALAAIVICTYLYIWLPSINPSVYLLYSRANKLFLKGSNQEVIALSGEIFAKKPDYLKIYPLLADTYWRMGNKEFALKYYFDYILYSEKKNDHVSLAAAYTGTGWIYFLQGEYSKSMDFYKKGLSIAEKNKDKLNEADILGKMAVWHIDKKEYDLGLELLTRSSEINRYRQNVYRHRYNLACDYFNLGWLFVNKGDFETARQFYDKSFKIFSRLKLKHELSDYYFNIGEIYFFQKEYQSALDAYNKGLGIDLALGHKPNLASDYNMLGELYLEMENFKEAEDYFNRAMNISLEIGARPELANAYDDLGQLYKKQNKKNKARENWRYAQEIYASINPQRYQEIKQELLALNN